MPKLLSRLGIFSSRRPFIIIAAWLLVSVFFTVVAATGLDTDGGNTAGSTRATEALSVVEEEFPTEDTGPAPTTLQLVIEARDDALITDPEVASDVAAVLDGAANLPHVASVSDPFDPASPYVSEDGTTVVSTVAFEGLDEDNQEATYEDVLHFADEAPDSVRVEFGGQLFGEEFEIFGPGEVVGIVIAFLVLFLTFGSLLVAGMNLLLAFVGVGVGVVGILAYSSISAIQPTTITLAVMLGLAVGIDYTLFVLTRFRSELREGRTVEEAIGRATGTAGTAVVFAGLTVIIALAGLSITGISSIRDMGFGGAFGVLVAVLAALTILPIVLRALGQRALPRKERNKRATAQPSNTENKKRSFLQKWVEFVVARPVVSVVGSVVVLLVIAAPMTSMRTASNVPGGSDPESSQRQAYNLIVDKFGGIQSPLIVLVQGDDVASSLPAVEETLGDLDNAQAVMPGTTNADGTVALVSVIPAGGSQDEGTLQLVADIRDQADSVSGVELEVTGETAIGIDSDEALHEALIKYIAVIVVLSFLLLIVMFRSLLVPLIATLGYLLSLGASFGASTAVFQWGWFDPIIAAPQGNPMISILPIILVGILFGLAMDYQVFLVSRIKEMHAKGMSPKEAIVSGFTRSGPVLVAAATIMTVVFAGFATSPQAIAASIAFGLVVGVITDAFIVRMIIVPALLSLLGESAWWMPRWLDRIIPDLDTEGHSLDAEEPVRHDDARVLTRV